PYSELFQEAPAVHYSQADLKSLKEYLDQSKNYCVARHQVQTKQYEQQLQQAGWDLMRIGGSESQRDKKHCEIQNLRLLHARSEVLAQEGIPIAFENRQAKLELL